MTAETGRRASRLELIRSRLHESGRRCSVRDGDATARTSIPVRAAVDHDVRPTGRDASHTAHNGVLRPVPRVADSDRRGSRLDTRPDRKVQSGNTNHDRQAPAEVRGRSKLDVGVDRQDYAEVRKPAPASSVPADRGHTSVEYTGHPLTAEHNDSSASKPRRLPQKTSSSSSLLSKSQNFFARLRSRKNDPSKTTKPVCRDGGSGNDSESNTKIRRSISEGGCAMYANRELVGNTENSVDVSPSSAHIDVVRSSHDVRAERRTVDRPEAVDSNEAAESTKDHVTTTSVYAEVEPLTSSSLLAGPDVVQPTESTSGSGQAGSSAMPTAVYEECAGSYSLREALLQRGGDTAVVDTPTSMTSSHVIRRPSTTSSPQPQADQVPLRKAQTGSLLPVGGATSDGCRSMSVAGWRRRKLATTHSTGCVVGGRREGRLERIQEVDSPPGSADDDEMSLRSPYAANSLDTEQRVGSDSTQRGSDARNCKLSV